MAELIVDRLCPIAQYGRMSNEALDVEKVEQLKEGRTDMWLIREMGLTRTAGYSLLRDGIFPKDEAKKRRALEKLSKIFGVDEQQLILRLEAKKVG